MQIARHFLCLAITALLATGCGDSTTEIETITIDDLVGSWTASSHVFTNNASPAQSFDLIANGGEVRITVLADGGARTWVTLGTFNDEWDAVLTLNGNTLFSTPVEMSRAARRWTVTLNGDALTLTDADSQFDFTLSNAAEVPATEVIALERN